MAQSYTQVFIGDKKKIDPNLKIQRKHNIISEFENTKKTLYNNSSSPSIIIQKKINILRLSFKKKNLIQITISSQTLRCAFRYAK